MSTPPTALNVSHLGDCPDLIHNKVLASRPPARARMARYGKSIHAYTPPVERLAKSFERQKHQLRPAPASVRTNADGKLLQNEVIRRVVFKNSIPWFFKTGVLLAVR